ncbi:Uncharacterized protein Fot_28374 [Forsythia ovata]|uniref:Uncharacterized protein n=1 Tax=Forsythia ovata TaxID=205694 RepID=A0ABD1TP90_9LAMI
MAKKKRIVESMSGGPIPGGRTSVCIVVVGDRATRKFSLIAAAASETFSREVPSVLPPTHIPADFYPDNVPITIIDTSSRFEFVCVVANFTTDLCLTGIIGFGVIIIHSLEYRGRLAEELKRADAVVLTYACDHLMTLNRICSFWIYELRMKFFPTFWELVILPWVAMVVRELHRLLSGFMIHVMQEHIQAKTNTIQENQETSTPKPQKTDNTDFEPK